MKTYVTKAPFSETLREITKDRSDARSLVRQVVRSGSDGQFKFKTKSGRTFNVSSGGLRTKTA
jgi:hypothetical protein